MIKSFVFFVSCAILILSLEARSETRYEEHQYPIKKTYKKKKKDIWSEEPPFQVRDSQRSLGYFQAGGGLGLLIEYGDLTTAWGVASSVGFASKSGWGAELFFGLLPHQSNASIETRTISADSKILGLAPTYTLTFDQLQLRIGLGVGYLVVNRSYYLNPGSTEESLYRWSLAPALELGTNLSPELYAHLGCRAVFTIAEEKHVNEPRIILPTIGLGYRF